MAFRTLFQEPLSNVLYPPGSGVDAQPLVQNAINALPSIGGRILLKNGTYNLGSKLILKTGTFLEAESPLTTIGLLPTFTNGVFCIENTAASSLPTTPQDFDMTMRGFTIDLTGDLTHPSGGIRFLGVGRMRFEDNRIKHGKAYGFLLSGTTYSVNSDCFINRNIFDASTQAGASFDAIDVGNCDYCSLIDNKVILGSGTAGDAISCEGLQFSSIIGNRIKGGASASLGGNGFTLYGLNDCVLLGNSGDSIKHSAIFIDKAVDFAGTPNGARISINGCSWKNVNYGGVAYGFNFNNVNALTMKNVGITLQNASPGPILVQSGATGIIVKDCPGINVGIGSLLGLDNRSGITSADGSPITLYAVPAGAGQLFRITADIFATAFTSGTATYTITWTENAVTRTLVVTATALNTLGTGSDLINPDASTNITAQLTGVFTATVKVAAIVEQIA